MLEFRVASLCFALGLTVAAGSDPAAAQPSGIVVAVLQSATADAATGQRVLLPDAPIFDGESVVTDGVGEAQIRFRDGTKLVVGPNSHIVIDAFIFNDDNTVSKVAINVAQGALRFITGSSPKDAYTVTTPTATIGVRGTIFDLNVAIGGVTRLLNLEGATRQCSRPAPGRNARPSECVETSDSCGVSVSQPGRSIEQLKYLPEVVRSLDRYFKYEHDQGGLRQEFQADTSRCQELRRLVQDKLEPKSVSPN